MNDEMLNIRCEELVNLIDDFPQEAAGIIAMLSAAEEGCAEVSEPPA